jgi:hypothetical protein
MKTVSLLLDWLKLASGATPAGSRLTGAATCPATATGRLAGGPPWTWPPWMPNIDKSAADICVDSFLMLTSGAAPRLAAALTIGARFDLTYAVNLLTSATGAGSPSSRSCMSQKTCQ